MLGVLEVDRGQRGAGLGRQLPEKDIGDGDEDVQVLRAGDVDEEGEHRQDVHPVEDLVRRDRGAALPAEAPKGSRDQGGYWPPRRRRIAALGHTRGVLTEHPDDDGGDQPEDDQGVDLVALVELTRPDDETVDQRHQYADQDQHAKKILEKRDPGRAAEHGEAESRKNAFAEGLDDGGQ